MDVATLVGLLAGAVLVGGGIVQPSLLAPPLLGIYAIGGGLAVVLLAHPLADAIRLPSVLLRTLLARRHDPLGIIRRLVSFSGIARREGILALEQELAPRDPPLLQAGIRLAVDGTEPDLLMDILETELRFVTDRHARGRRLVHDFGLGMVLFGLVGALTAVWQGAAGGRLALPLLYGWTLGGLVCWPLSRKLEENHERETLTRLMTIEGIMAIRSGDNPRLVEHKLSVFLEPAARPGGDRQPAARRPPSGPDDTAQRLAEFLEWQRPRLAALARQAAGQHQGSAEEVRAVEQLADRLARGEIGAVQLLGALGGDVRAQVLAQAGHRPPPLLAATRAAGAALTFADLARLTDPEIRTLLREVEQRHLVLALKAADETVRRRLLGNTSERVRAFLADEIDLARPRPEVVVDAQARILAQVYQLADQALVTLPPQP